jgi:hypothetical protein
VLCAVLVTSTAACVEDTNFLNPLDYFASTKSDAAVGDDAAVIAAGQGGSGGKAGKDGGASGTGATEDSDASTGTDASSVGNLDASAPDPDSGSAAGTSAAGTSAAGTSAAGTSAAGSGGMGGDEDAGL